MGSMSASDAAPLPRLGEVFFDVRGNSRSMRLSWYADTGVAVFSIWQGGMCTGTFRLAIADLPRMVDTLQRGPGGQRAEWDDAEAAGQQAFAEPMDATAQVQMEPLLAQGRPDYPDGPADPLCPPPPPRLPPPPAPTPPPARSLHPPARSLHPPGRSLVPPARSLDRCAGLFHPSGKPSDRRLPGAADRPGRLPERAG
jgi:hypothetical protein